MKLFGVHFLPLGLSVPSSLPQAAAYIPFHEVAMFPNTLSYSECPGVDPRERQCWPIAWLPLFCGVTLPRVLHHASQSAMEDHCTGDLAIWVLILAQKLTRWVILELSVGQFLPLYLVISSSD